MAMVRALCVVENRSIGRFPVEGGQVGKEQVFVVVDEGFLKRVVEMFGMGVRRCLGAQDLGERAGGVAA